MELGRGQFGVTLQAKRIDDPNDKTEYAVKTIKKKILTSEEAIEDVRREVKIMEELKDQANVVHLFEVFEDRQVRFSINTDYFRCLIKEKILMFVWLYCL